MNISWGGQRSRGLAMRCFMSADDGENLVFGSESTPRRSNLQRFCTPKTPVKGTDWMDVWPGTLPSDRRSSVARKIWIYHQARVRTTSLGKRNRVCLTHGLGRDWLSTRDETPRVIPDSSHGSALRLRVVVWHFISGVAKPTLVYHWPLHFTVKHEVGQVVSACYCRS